MIKNHSFHIPVMGMGFTIDTPLKVAQYGMDSVIAIGDDILLEKLRKMYCGKFNLTYKEITKSSPDYRAKRITSYLNLINGLALEKFEALKSATLDTGNQLKSHFSMLPSGASIKQEFKNLTDKYSKNWLKSNLSMGSIDVNIMTKLDKENFVNGEKLPVEFNDAHAALRGYANSNLSSSIVFSAGMNPRLYAYLEQFEDFYPANNGEIKKKIILKVSDFRSALIQGKFLAKKGLWVSEYRIESGLNCGGHAFATEGHLMGPILAEFREKRIELLESVQEVLFNALEIKNKVLPDSGLNLKISAQGGVGTAEEHQFLLDHYQVDSVGWGTPFLLVPEATNVDQDTRDKLIKAEEKDLYLSNVSPLGVPFNNLRGNTKDTEKVAMVDKGRPGSSCPKKFLALNKEFTDEAICTASRQYQHLKMKALDKQDLSPKEHEREYNKVADKSCICVGLGTPALLVNNMDTKTEGTGVSVCPGPNMAYFSKEMSLEEITDHIYGRTNVITRTDRPNMFIKELNIYIDYLKDKMDDIRGTITNKEERYFLNFTTNLKEGIRYYSDLFGQLKGDFENNKANILNELNLSNNMLQKLYSKIEKKSLL
jgi:hypothetical protein